MITTLAILILVLPAAGALLCAFLREKARPVALTTAVLVTVAAGWLVLSTFGAFHSSVLGDLPWLRGMIAAPVFGISVDPLALVMLLVVVPVGLLTVLYSTSYLTEKNQEHPVGTRQYGRYYFWLLLFISSMVGVALSPNFLQLLVFWELTTLCSWALISFHQDERSLRAGFKAMLMTQVGGAFLLVVALILFARTGSFEFSALSGLPDGLRKWVFVFLLIAAWAKAAQVPMQTWLPDAMEAPTGRGPHASCGSIERDLFGDRGAGGAGEHPVLGPVHGALHRRQGRQVLSAAAVVHGQHDRDSGLGGFTLLPRLLGVHDADVLLPGHI